MFEAKLDTTANSISEQSNALLVEFLADNPDGVLKPGGFAQVSIHLGAPADTISVPASALMFNEHGLRIATVSADNRIVMKTVKVARDLGTTVEIDAGLNRGDRIVDNPPDSLANGELVHPQQSSAPAANDQ